MAVPSKDALSQGVVTWLKLGDADNGVLALVVGATLAYVRRLPVASNEEATDDVVLGATMLAARMYRRRNSPNGVEAVTESGTSYVARHDPDVSRLLQLDQHAAPYAI